MRRWIEIAASLKLTVILLLVLGVVLAIGTIIESLAGVEAARSVYYAPWFFALQGLFGLNLLAALIERWPRNRWRVGFALTHASMILILAGAAMTWFFKTEGSLPIWEGQRSNVVFRPGPADQEPFELPFEIRVDSFEIDHYPGTRRPAMFRSRVVVVEPDGGETPAVIEMNKPLRHGGYSFFQSSYQIQGGREMTILSVSNDPGEAIVFLGYSLLVAGMIVVFATRLIQYRKAELRAAAGAVVALVAIVGALGTGASPAAAATVPDAATVERARALPVQHDGRAMPFDTQARDAVRTVTRLRAWPGIEPVAMVLGWVTDPQGWQGEPIVRMRSDVAALAGLPAGARFASFRELVRNETLLGAMRAAEERQRQSEGKPAPLDKHLLELSGRLETLAGYFRGESLRPFPAADPVAAWEAYRPTDASALRGLEARVRATAPDHYPEPAAIARELRYNRTRPSRIAWWLLVPAALAAGMTLERGRFGLDWVARLGLVGGFLVMTWGLAERWAIAGRIPASNMYESMLFLAWGVGLGGIVSVALRNRMLIFNTAALSALVMVLIDRLPMDPFIHPMPPVLSGTPWLAIHVPIIMLGYAGLTIVTFFAHLVVGVEIFASRRRDLIERWSQLAYWYTHVGSIFLIAGILTGSIWAASSWGRYWGWDPKEVWSLVAFLAYMAILHARFDQQIHDFGVAVGSIVAYWTILMTYLGVNFILAAGLHSYGFGSSGMVRTLTLVLVAEALFLGAGWRAVRKRVAAG